MASPGPILWIAAILGGLAIAALLRTLTWSAALLAACFAITLYAAGGIAWVLVPVAFLLTASLWTRWPGKSRDHDRPRRSIQVFSNGFVAFAASLLYLVHPSPAASTMIAGAYAAAAADTWATEWGSGLGGRPLSLRTLRLTAAGHSGAVSFVGTFASITGALFIAWTGVATGMLTRAMLVPVAVAGFAGGLADSVAGAWLQGIWRTSEGDYVEEKPDDATIIRGVGWINNDVVNLLATLVGALVAWALNAYVPVD